MILLTLNILLSQLLLSLSTPLLLHSAGHSLHRSKNKNKYILVIVDIATNEFDIEPLKNKSAEDVLEGSKKILKRSYLNILR